MNSDLPTPAPPRWLHGLAVLTVLLALPLVFLGASVTSHDVGMVDARGFRWPWEIVRGLFENNGLGWLLEYGHRTFGFLVGFCGIGLALGCWWAGRGIAWVGLFALAMICAQGALGAIRVNYNAIDGRTYAMIHGLFAQLVFATLIAVALFTSRRWTTAPYEPASPSFQRWSIITAGVVFGQLVLGGLVRHQESPFGPRGHLLGAFVVVGAVVWLLKLMKEEAVAKPALTPSPSPRGRGEEVYKFARVFLMALLTLQLWLGVESWLAKFYDPRVNFPQLAPAPTHAEWIRTVHYLVGTLIFSATVGVALFAHRRPALTLGAAPTTVAYASGSDVLEGAL